MATEEEKKERSFEHNGIKYKVRRPSVEESQAANQMRSKNSHIRVYAKKSLIMRSN